MKLIDKREIGLKTSNEKQAKPVWQKILLFILGFLILAVGVPLIINECYKATPVYITKWNAADVLSYYGALLSGIITVGILAATIRFTRKQLQRERFLERSRIRWGKVESIITQSLIDISPLNMHGNCEIDMKNSIIVNIHIIISTLQSYAAKAKTSLDMIKCYVNPTEYTQISDYMEELNNAIKQFCSIESELESQYMALQAFGVTHDGKIPDAMLIIFLNQANEITKKIPTAYNGPYQRLLNMKREVFEKIYADIDAQADQILRFGRKW